MRLEANYHTHLKLCGHATGMSEDYIKEAIRLGFTEIGMSDHLFVPRSFMSKEDYIRNWLERQMTEADFYNIYLKDLENTINKYGKQIKIYKGAETEYILGHIDHYKRVRQHLDYLNLGLHFFNEDGIFYNSYEYMDSNLLKKYAQNAIKAMDTHLFKVFVHPDLFMYNYYGENGHYSFDEKAEKESRKMIECAIKNDVYLEYNCGGLRQNFIPYDGKVINSYPRDEFWKIVSEYKDAKIIIGADAHKIESLSDEATIRAIKNLERLNIKRETKITF